MSLVQKILQAFLGNKSQRDIQAILPLFKKSKNLNQNIPVSHMMSYVTLLLNYALYIQEAVKPMQTQIDSLQNS
jgi:hypothetical protein